MKKTILIVDDEKDLRDALSTAFRDEGCETLEAENGEEGLSAALEHKPDLILLDIVMPKLNGLDMLEKLRGDEWGKNAKVVLLTVLEDVGTVSRAIEKGGYDYFVKTDWDLKDIVQKVKERLGD